MPANYDHSHPEINYQRFLPAEAQQYLRALGGNLPEQIDKRLAATFSTLVKSILLNCNTKLELLLSELGESVAAYAHIPAGTKRTSNLE